MKYRSSSLTMRNCNARLYDFRSLWLWPTFSFSFCLYVFGCSLVMSSWFNSLVGITSLPIVCSAKLHLDPSMINSYQFPVFYLVLYAWHFANSYVRCSGKWPIGEKSKQNMNAFFFHRDVALRSENIPHDERCVLEVLTSHTTALLFCVITTEFETKRTLYASIPWKIIFYAHQSTHLWALIPPEVRMGLQSQRK